MNGDGWSVPYDLVIDLIRAANEESGFRILREIDLLSKAARATAISAIGRVVLPERVREIVKKYLVTVNEDRVSAWNGAACMGVTELLFLESTLAEGLRGTSDTVRDAVYFFRNPANQSDIKNLRRVNRGFAGDRAAECYYILTDSIAKCASRAEYNTMAELAQLSYNHALYDEEKSNITRFGEGGVVYKAGRKVHRARRAEVVVPSIERDAGRYELLIQTLLRSGSLSGVATLPPRLRRRLLSVQGVRLFDLYLYLRGWVFKPTALSRLLQTSLDHQHTENAYERFYDSLVQSTRRGRATSQTIAWIIPDEYLHESMRSLLESCEVQGGVKPDVESWLPWISLSVVNCLRQWRRPLITALRRAIFKLANEFDPDGSGRYPWECELKREVRFIPIEAIYQYEPTTAILKAIKTLIAFGFRSVNDLRFLHLDAVRLAKQTDEPLLKVYRCLRRSL